jgi:Tol biopolymer transport system component/imidazolonepropionase-like amidohydrolase
MPSLRTLYRSTAFAALMLAAACATPVEAPASVADAAAAEMITVTFSEGTNMAATVSPDGATIVAAIQGTLWSIPASGGKAKALTQAEMDAHEPVFSPDGKLVAFYAFAKDGWSVWTMSPDGSNLVQQSEEGIGDARYPSFGPDGTLYYSWDADGGYSAVSLNLATGARTVHVASTDVGYKPPTEPYFQKAGNVVTPIVSPDGKSLAYVVDGQSDTLFVRPLAGGEAKAIYSVSNLGAPVWTADGASLLVVGVGRGDSHLASVPAAGGEPKMLLDTGDIFAFRPSLTPAGVTVTADGLIKTIPLAGGAPVVTPFEASVTFPKTVNPGRKYNFADATPQRALGIFDPALSPDGSKAVFTALGDLWVSDVATGALTNLTNDEAVDLSPSWSLDGKLIAFISDRGGKSDIWTVTPDGKTYKKLTDLAKPPNAPSWSPDGTKITFLQDSAQRASIFLAGTVEVLDVKSGKVTRVMDELFGPSQPSFSPDGVSVAVVARKPLTSRFREGHNALMLAPVEGEAAPQWVSPVEGVSLGRRQWNRPAWSSKGDIVYRVDGELWVTQLDSKGALSGEPKLIADQGENPSWSGDGSKLIYVDGSKLNVWDKASGRTTEVKAPEWSREIPDSAYTIRVGKLFDGKGETYQSNVDVVVEKNIIKSVSAAGSSPVVGTLVDASTKVMLPGFIEGHTHQSTSLGRALGERWLSYGVTSVRETGTDAYEAVERREAEASGKRSKGPRVFTAGPLNEGSRVSYGISETLGTPELAVKAMVRSEQLKLDMIKSYVRQDYTTQKALVTEAHKTGMMISGHELYPAVANGVDQMEHFGATSRRGYSTKSSRLNYTYGDVISLLSKSGMIITPTLALSTGNGTRIEPQVLQTLKTMYDSGVRIMAGVDSPFVTFADTFHTEMRIYSLAGIPNWKVLQIATSGNAELLHAGDQIGSIAPGMIADVILVDGDPLANITDTMKVTWVMKNGEVVWEKK